MKTIIIIVIIISNIFAQNVENIFSNDSKESDKYSMQLTQDLDLTNIENLTYTPVEQPIDPNTYILGPGDLLGISIISTKNITLPIRINPVGEIMIPSVGVLNVSDISLADAKIKISKYIVNTSLKNSIVNVTLLDVRRFKIQVLGAVHNPGFVNMSSVDKVYDAILQSGGFQKHAHKSIVKIFRGEKTFEINLKNYLSGKDASQNVVLNSGDLIIVPFNDFANSLGLSSDDINNNHVIVYGFVNRNGSGNIFKYYPGYTVQDYIAMAGGTKEQGSSFKSGNISKSILYRTDGTIIKHAIDELTLPGDIIEVPASRLYQIIGGDGVVRMLSTLASIASSVYIIDSVIERSK